MFHEFIRKTEEKEDKKCNQPNYENVKDEGIKTEEDEELHDNNTKEKKRKKFKNRKRTN